MKDIIIITEKQADAMFEAEEKSGRAYLEFCSGTEDEDGFLYSIYRDERTGKKYGYRTTRSVYMGFNSNEEGKAEEFISIVEREGACIAFWGVTGRTMHLHLAQQFADSLPQYEWKLDYESYGCKAMKK